MPSDFSILPIADPSDKYFVKHELFDLPAKCLIVGKSLLSGKTTITINLLARFYKDVIEPENIYIVSKTIHQVKWQKFIEYLDIPAENLYDSFDSGEITDLYNMIKEDFEEIRQQGETPPQRVIVFDDLAYSGMFSSATSHNASNIIDEIVLNGRHVLLSPFILCQKYTQLSTTIRENATALILYEATNKQWETIADDHATMDKKTFIKEAKKATANSHDFMFINYSKPHRFYHNFTDPILKDTET